MKTISTFLDINAKVPPLPTPIPTPIPSPIPKPLPIPNDPRNPSNIDPSIFIDPIVQPWRFRSLKAGCYLLNYDPVNNFLTQFDGTIRVESDGLFNKIASGDLYQRPLQFTSFPFSVGLTPAPNPANGIPILSRNRYRYYLRITQILDSFTISNSFTLGFEMHKYTASSNGWSSIGSWSNEGAFTATMKWISPPSQYPSNAQYLEGDVRDSSGNITGRLKMGWVSSFLRKATVEIDSVAQSQAPLNNGNGLDWKQVGEEIGWDITVDQSQNNVQEPSGEFWSDGELHAEMLARRDFNNLDREWRYHILAVRRLESTSRGIMYDAFGSDSNNVPREGCAISSHWTIPNSEEWGTAQGQRFGVATAPYFRTAVHELGHALGLLHNTSDIGFMNTTGVIANSSLNPGSASFPANIQWSFNSADVKRLKHFPDIYIRPGATPFGNFYNSTPLSPNDGIELEDLNLTVDTVLEVFPLGAPVRVNLSLKNDSTSPHIVPHSLSMKKGHVRGYVLDSHGIKRTFQPIVISCDDDCSHRLDPNQEIKNSLTLLRGIDGALFPDSGLYKIVVEVKWDKSGMAFSVTGKQDVYISPAANEKHMLVAKKLLSTPDTLLTLVFGGDHLEDGIEAIQAALKTSELKPHYDYIEGKRLSMKFKNRKASFNKCANILDSKSVLSDAELKKLKRLSDSEKKTSKSAKKIANLYKKQMTA